MQVEKKETAKVFQELQSISKLKNFGVTTNRVNNRHAGNICESLEKHGIIFDNIDFEIESPKIGGAMFTGSSRKGRVQMIVSLIL